MASKPQRPKGTGSYRSRGKSSWEIRVAGKYETLRGTEAQARKRLKQMAAELDSKTYVPPARITLGEYLQRHLEARLASGKIRLRTFDDYQGILRRHLPTTLLERRLDRVTGLDLQTLMTRLQQPREEGGHGLGAKTARHTFVLLNSTLKRAAGQRVIPFNPMAAVEGPTVRQGVEEEAPLAVANALNAEQAMHLLATAKRLDEEARSTHGRGQKVRRELHALWTVLLTTGLRPGEALALRWMDIELEEGRLEVRRTLVTKNGQPSHFDSPKTAKSRRQVDLPPLTVEALRDHKAREGTRRDGTINLSRVQAEALVFATRDGKPLAQRNLVRSFKSLLAAAKLPQTIRMYDLRHSAATLLGKATGNPLLVSRALGHSTTKLTLDVYSHVFPEDKREAALALEKMLRAAGGGQ